LLWVGWFGFNAGSALSAGGLASSAFIATHFAAASAALGWAFYEWIKTGKATVLGAISGAVAGLVVITPASGYTTPMYAIVMGLIGGVACALASTVLKTKLGYDDSLDAFGVHGVGGTLGAILTGVFAVAAINLPTAYAPAANAVARLGLLEGNTAVMINQLLATLITWAIAAGGTWLLLKLVQLLIGLRVSEEDEYAGLDLSQHGEQGYIMEEGLSGLVVHGSHATVAAPAPSPATFAANLTTA
jgi:Amt family ammonium transporter